MGTIKVQINSAEALERFIGKNPKFEVEIQKQIAYQILDRHLSNKLNNLGEQLVENLLCDASGSGYNRTLKLKPNVLEIAQKAVLSKVEVLLGEVCEKVYDVNAIKGKAYELLERQSAWIEKELSEAILTGRIEKMVDEKIKSRMGIK